MRKTRILAAFLAAVMLLPTLASCANDIDTPDETRASTQAFTEEETGLHDDLPDDLYYNGDEVTIISRYKEGWTSGEIAVEGVKGEPVNDVVFERNKAVEERLGIKIISIEDDDPGEHTVVNRVALAVKGGTKDYDIMAAACYATLPETLNGTFINLRSDDCDYLDLDQIWWTQGLNEAVEYQGAQYAILGSMVLSMYRFGFITVFNKERFTDASQPYLYDYVQDGSWTLDKQSQIIPLFYRDNGDGVRDMTDTYGFVSSTYTNIDAYWSACQLDIVKKDADGELEMVLDMDRLHGAADKLIHLFHNTDGGTYDIPSRNDAEIWPNIRQMFADGKGAMASFRFLELENAIMRNMEEEYGVVPMPKYDQDQDGYYTLLHDQFTVLAIPATVTGDRLNQMSAVLEAMSSTSYRIVRPVYYEENLRTKVAQDPTAAEMMDIITENVYIDAGILYISFLSGFHHSLREVVYSGNNNTASLFKSKNKVCEKQLKNLGNKLDRVQQRQGG